jgi:predicted MFS family arabinose efflux permease
MLGASIAAAVGLRAPFLLTAGVLALAAGLAIFLVPRNGQENSPAPHE